MQSKLVMFVVVSALVMFSVGCPAAQKTTTNDASAQPEVPATPPTTESASSDAGEPDVSTSD